MRKTGFRAKTVSALLGLVCAGFCFRQAAAESGQFAAFEQQLAPATRQRETAKLSLLRDLAHNRKATRNAVYLLYYNAALANRGKPHAFLAVDGLAFEHGIQNSGKRFGVQTEPLSATLDDIGRLPAAVITIPVSPVQKQQISRKLKSSNAPFGPFNSFNRGPNKNCIGLPYDALQRAGLPLPKLRPWQVFPRTVSRIIYGHTPGAKIEGRMGGDLFRWPRINGRNLRRLWRTFKVVRRVQKRARQAQLKAR